MTKELNVIPDIDNDNENNAGEPIAEPAKKRAYKPRAPKLQTETLDTGETPVRKPRQKKASIEGTARQIEGIHKMIAMLPNMGFMELQPQECNALAEAMVSVAQEYDVQISGKTGATIQLLAAASMIYAPRAIYFAKARKEAKKLMNENIQTPEKVEPLTVVSNNSDNV